MNYELRATNMTQIIPSILVSSEEEFKKQINSVKDKVKMAHIDLADGKFVPNKTWTYQSPKTAQQYLDIDFELHLMVADPLKTAKDWLDNPRLKRILVHYESTADIKKVIGELSISGKPVSVVLNPDTSILALEPLLNEIQGVMFMGVKPGWQGQNFIPETLDKIKKFKKNKTAHFVACHEAKLFVEVDGAVNEKTLPDIVRAGADGVCPGSAIFGNKKTPAKNIQNLQKIILSVHSQ